MSTIRLSRHYLNSMLKKNDGRIIIISSEVGFRPLPEMAHYSLTKAAQLNLARGMAEMTKGTRVTVNSLLPGPTLTEGVQEYLVGLAKQQNKTYEQAMQDYFVSFEPTSIIQRFLKPEEVASTVVYLASDKASGINGSALRCEGGIIRHL